MSHARLMSTLALAASLLFVGCSQAAAAHKGPAMVVVMETGTIRVVNDSSFPMQIALDGAQVGHVAAGSNLVLTSTPVGVHHLVARYPGREDVPTRTFKVHVHAGQMAAAVIQQPSGSVLVHNPNAFTVDLVVAGMSRGSLPGGATVTVGAVLPGRQDIAVRAPGGAVVAGRVHVLPGRTARWEPALFTGALRVHNDNPFMVKVLVDGRPVGKLLPGASRTVDGLAPGHHRIEVRGQAGLSVVHTANVRAAQTTTWAFAAPHGPHHHAAVAAGPAYAPVPKGGPGWNKGGPKKGGWKKGH